MTTVLLVDDDPMQAILRKSVLERRFQKVVRVTDAAEALGMMDKPYFAKSVDLVVTGLHMPGLDGPGFAAELNRRIPRVPILVLDSADEDDSIPPGGPVRFLNSPFRAEDMLRTATSMVTTQVA